MTAASPTPSLTSVVRASRMSKAERDVDSEAPPEARQPAGPSAMEKRAAFTTVAKACVVLIITFWIASLWIFGGLWKSADRAHLLNVLVVDFDGGPIGEALLQAAASMSGPTIPHFDVRDASTTSPEAIQHLVWKGDAWGAIYASPNASQALSAALESDDVAASYDGSAALSFTGLEVRYTTTWSGILQPKLVALEAATLATYTSTTLTALLPTLNTTSFGPSQSKVLFKPFSATFINQTPFDFGSRVLFQTIGMVLPVLLQFFLLARMNGVFTALGLFRGTSMRQLVLWRVSITTLWTLATSLSVSGWSVAFSEVEHFATARGFFALWAVQWAFAMITIDLLDFGTTFLPMPLHAPLVVLYIIISVASDVNPIQLANHFFKVHYAVPVHIVWSLMMTIYGRGAVNTLSYNLPLLFGWLVIGKAGVWFALRKRSRDGWALV